MPVETFIPLINGAAYSGASVTVNILGVSLPGLRKVNFKEGQKKENIYGAGAQPVARASGRVEPSGSITVLLTDFLALQNAAPNKKLHQIASFDTTISYQEGGKVSVIVLEQCEFTEYSVDHSTDDMKIEVTLPLVLAAVTRKR